MQKFWTKEEVFQHPDFAFGIIDANPQPPNPLHMHKGFWELVIVYKGEGIHYTEDAEYTIRAGDVFIIKGSQKHGYKNTNALSLKNICFSPNQILSQTKRAKKLPGYHVLFNLEPKFRKAHQFENRLKLSPDETAHIISIVSLMENELMESLPGYEYSVISLFTQAVCFLCRCYSRTNHPACDIMEMAEIISYLEANYSSKIELSRLCEMAHMSTSVLLRRFRKSTGFSPVDYLLRVRISRAIELLQNENISIIDIALAVGFSDSNYFSRQFKRIMNMSPSKYRSLMKPLI